MMDLITQSRLRDHVIAELTAIGGRIKGDEIIILCAFHQDSRPSLQVHIGHNITPGGFHCFSCGAHGGWNKLAGALRLREFAYAGFGSGIRATATPGKPGEQIDPFELLSRVLQKTEVLTAQSLHQKEGLEPLDKNFTWRGLGKRFLECYGARFFWDREKDVEFLYFPLLMNKDYVGYTVAAITPGFKPKYRTFADTHRVFFLYDHVPNNGPVYLVEGHYDALRLQADGLPAMALFGTQNWSPTKRAFLAAKNPTKVIILMDGDDAGYKATETIFNDLRAGFNVIPYTLPNQPDNPIDPGNMSDWLVEEVRKL